MYATNEVLCADFLSLHSCALTVLTLHMYIFSLVLTDNEDGIRGVIVWFFNKVKLFCDFDCVARLDDFLSWYNERSSKLHDFTAPKHLWCYLAFMADMAIHDPPKFSPK